MLPSKFDDEVDDLAVQLLLQAQVFCECVLALLFLHPSLWNAVAVVFAGCVECRGVVWSSVW